MEFSLSVLMIGKIHWSSVGVTCATEFFFIVWHVFGHERLDTNWACTCCLLFWKWVFSVSKTAKHVAQVVLGVWLLVFKTKTSKTETIKYKQNTLTTVCNGLNNLYANKHSNLPPAASSSSFSLANIHFWSLHQPTGRLQTVCWRTSNYGLSTPKRVRLISSWYLLVHKEFLSSQCMEALNINSE
jgi:hypothetical protein